MASTLRFDIFHSADSRISTSPLELATGDTPFVGAEIAMQGFERCFFLIAVGEFADTDATLTPLVEDEFGAAGFNAVADLQLIPTTGAELVLADDAAGEDATLVIGYQGNGDRVRLTLTPASNTGVLVVSVIALLTGADHGARRTVQVVQ